MDPDHDPFELEDPEDRWNRLVASRARARRAEFRDDSMYNIRYQYSKPRRSDRDQEQSSSSTGSFEARDSTHRQATQQSAIVDDSIIGLYSSGRTLEEELESALSIAIDLDRVISSLNHDSTHKKSALGNGTIESQLRVDDLMSEIALTTDRLIREKDATSDLSDMLKWMKIVTRLNKSLADKNNEWTGM